MSEIIIQIISLILGVVFLFMSFWFSRKHEHSLAPAVIIIAAIFFFCGLFHIEGLLKTLMLEQVACWVVALVFLVAAFRFLQREKISLAFTVFILAAIFFFCSLSGVQSLLKTGMLSTVTNTLIKYGEKLDDFQLTIAKMKEDLSGQQAQIKNQQDIILKAQLDVATQQINITNQNERILSLQGVLSVAQSNVDKISAEMVKQQITLDSHQTELENQQAVIRQAQIDVGIQQAGLTNQFSQMLQMQNNLVVAQTNISKQQRKIEDVESLINGLYSRIVVEVFPISDSSRVTVQGMGWKNARIFFRLKNVPVPNSIQATEQSHPGLIRGLLGLIVGSSYGREISVAVGNNKNIVFSDLGVPKWDMPEYPNNAVFILKYTKKEQETNLFKKVEVKGKNVFFDNERQVFK